MADQSGWQKVEGIQARIYTPQDAAILKSVHPDGEEHILMAINFASGDGTSGPNDDDRAIMIFFSDAMKLVRLISQRASAFGDPTAKKVLKVFEDNWGPRPPRDE